MYLLMAVKSWIKSNNRGTLRLLKECPVIIDKIKKDKRLTFEEQKQLVDDAIYDLNSRSKLKLEPRHRADKRRQPGERR